MVVRWTALIAMKLTWKREIIEKRLVGVMTVRLERRQFKWVYIQHGDLTVLSTASAHPQGRADEARFLSRSYTLGLFLWQRKLEDGSKVFYIYFAYLVLSIFIYIWVEYLKFRKK